MAEQVISFDEFKVKLSRKEPFNGYVKNIGRASTLPTPHGMIQYLDMSPELDRVERKVFSDVEKQMNKKNEPNFSFVQQDATYVDMKERTVEIQTQISNIEKQKIARIIEQQLDELQKKLEVEYDLKKELANFDKRMSSSSNNMRTDTFQPCNYQNSSAAYQKTNPWYNSIPSYINQVNGTVSIGISSKGNFIDGQITTIKKSPIPKNGMFAADNAGNISFMDENTIAKLRENQISDLKKGASHYKKLSKGSTIISLVLIGADVYINGELKISHVVDAALAVGFYFLSSTGIGLGIVAIYIVADIALSFITDKSLTQHIMEGIGIEDKTLLKAKEKPKHVPRYNGYDQYQSELRPAPYPSYRRR